MINNNALISLIQEHFSDSMLQLKEHDQYTYEHSMNVANGSLLIGCSFGYTDEQLTELVSAAMLHDIGKIFVPQEVIQKSGPLTNAEWECIKKHPELGSEFVQSLHCSENISAAILSHHENYNGSGYPFGLKKNQIPLNGRIIRIVDTFDALTSARSYRDAYDKSYALHYIGEYKGLLFDPFLAKLIIHRKIF